MKASKKGVQTNQQRYIGDIKLYILIVIVAIAPFFGGLHHTVNRLAFTVLCLVVCGVWMVFRANSTHDGEFRLGLADMAAAAFLLIYFAGTFGAASANGAISTLLTRSALLALFWVWAKLGHTSNEKEWLYSAVMTASVGIAIWGLLGYVRLVPAVGSLVDGRISAGLLYANATASILLVGLLLALVLGFKDDTGSHWSLIYTGCAIAIVPAFLLTLSRGAWLALVLVMPLLIYSQRHALMRFIAYLAVLGSAGLFATFLIAVWSSLVSLLGVFMLAMVVSILIRQYLRFSSRAIVAILFVVIIVLGAYTGYRVSSSNVYASKINPNIPWQTITMEIPEVSGGEYVLKAGLAITGPNAATTLSLWTIVEGTKVVNLLSQSFAAGNHQVSGAVTLPNDVQDLLLEFVTGNVGTQSTLTEPLLEGPHSLAFVSLPHRLLPYSLASRVSQMTGDSL